MERYSTDEGYEERILDAENAAAELSDEDDLRATLDRLRDVSAPLFPSVGERD